MSRSQTEIRSDLAAAQKAYEAAFEKEPAAKVREASQRVKALMGELSDALTVGAEPCERCGRKPHGLRHVHGRGAGVSADGKPIVFFSHRFEVGCLSCPDMRAVATTPEEANGADLEQYAADTIARAVKKWNDEQYLPARAKPAAAS